ncbi:MAG: hypothetical protein IKE38_04835, partial [Erysipelotrichaceae bacterium]|nr:hypothetical protein [Erysipelotrichaceae bacterium]
MKEERKIISKLMFRLLPIQVLLAAIGAINGIVSSLFASNFISVDALSAVGLYAPLNMFISAVSTMLVGGATIICGKYIGRNELDKTQRVFSLDLALSILISLVFASVILVMGVFDLSGILTKDTAIREILNVYLIGQSLGVLPLVLGNQLSAFLSLENKVRLTMIASVVYILVNLVLDFVFIQVLQMGALGLSLASSIGLWVFLMIQATYFFKKDSVLRFSLRNVAFNECGDMLKIGMPGAMSYGYQSLRGIIVNSLLLAYVGSIGVSAFTASNTFLNVFWGIPGGMLAVSRMMMSISVGEEDRKTLADVMRVMMYGFLPLMCLICLAIILSAKPLTSLYYRDTTQAIYMMTVWGFRILPLSMPLSIIYMHFVCYGQASEKHILVHVLALLDGVVCVAGFTALLIPFIGMNSVYIANVLNGVVTTIVIVGYAILKKKRIPRNMDELMVIPDDFGVSEEDRIDISLDDMEEAIDISKKVQDFCLAKGTDKKRAYYAGLCMEEMA